MELTYKNLTATARYSEEDKAYIGRLNVIGSVVSFEAETEDELQNAFEEAAEDYLDFCQMKGIDQSKKKTLKDMLGNPSVEGNTVMHGSISLNSQTVEYDLNHIKIVNGPMIAESGNQCYGIPKVERVDTSDESKDAPGEFGNDEF